MEKEFPKVFIITEPFNNYTGMGVTMTNLFKDWPRERIAIAADYLDVELCEKIRPCQSYLVLSPPIKNKSSNKESTLQNLLKKLRNCAKYFYNKLGVSDIRSIPFGEPLKESIRDFQPDIIFTALGALNRIRLVNEVHKFYPLAKLAVYIVDDWPNTKQNGRWFPSIWKRKYNKSFRELLDKTSYFLSICQAMSESYMSQYGKRFIPFHNPVDNKAWGRVEAVRHYPKDIFAIVYVGKINQDTIENIITLAQVVDLLNKRGVKVHFDVYTPSKHQIDFSKYVGFSIMKAVSNEQIPKLLKGYDILYLTLGFSKISRAYTRLSMPTKLTEYLASGVPILLHAPNEIAVTKYVSQTNTGLICSVNSAAALENKLEMLINEAEVRNSIKKNALSLAREHDITIVRERFRKALSL
mgnify:FL=1